MAFDKAPSQSTYQTDEIKLIWTLFNRDEGLTKDPLLKNGFYDLVNEKDSKDNDYFVVKRDGCSLYPAVAPSTNVRGMYYWEDQDKLYIAYDDKMNIYTASNGTLQVVHTPFATTTGEVCFTEFYYEDGTSKIITGDGASLVSFDASNTPVIGTDPDMPPFIPSSIVYLDGYLFMIKAGTADIYNSDLNDPLAWTPGDFISAEMLPDTAIRISRLNNYLVVLGSSSVEYFFDAGNASGSPLQRNDTPVKQIGFLGGFATFGNKLLFVGQFSSSAPEVFILEDFKVEEVAAPQIRRMLLKTNSFNASVVSNGGHDFYVITFDGKTMAMDLDNKMWYNWTFGDTATFDIRNANIIYLANGYTSLFRLAGSVNLYFFNEAQAVDNVTAFPFEGVTRRMYLDTTRRKFMSKLAVIADKGTAALSVSWTDDDYQTYSTPRTVSLDSKWPRLHRLGSFHSRAFKYSYTGNQPVRLRHFEVDYNLGIK